jgi:hypothetical protein
VEVGSSDVGCGKLKGQHLKKGVKAHPPLVINKWTESLHPALHIAKTALFGGMSKR